MKTLSIVKAMVVWSIAHRNNWNCVKWGLKHGWIEINGGQH